MINASNLLDSMITFGNWPGGLGGGGAGSMPFNLGQFTTNGTVNVRSGALLTNTSLRFPALANATAVDSVVVLDGENQLTNSAVVSVTELDYLDGVTSGVQGQINARQGGNAALSNLVGTVARNVTNIISLSTSNATSRPLTNSYTSGVLTLLGLEQGTNVILYANGSNIVLNASAAGGSATTNFTVTTTDHSFITNLTIAGSSPGTITLSNTTGSAFVKLQMSDAGTSKTNALSFSAITPGQVVSFHDANGTLTNTTSAAGGAGSLDFHLSQFTTNGVVTIVKGALLSNVVIRAGNTVGNFTNQGPVYWEQTINGGSQAILDLSYVETGALLSTNASAYIFHNSTNNIPEGITSREIVTNIVNAISSSYTPLFLTNVTVSTTNFHINAGVAPANDTTFQLNLSANGGVTISGGQNGQLITVSFLQHSSGFKTVALTNLFYFGGDLPGPLTLTTNGNRRDLTRWQYQSESNHWMYMGKVGDF